MSIMSQEAKKQLGCVLHWNGAVASSNSQKAITANGNVKQLLPFPGAGIGMFDGTGDYIQCQEDTVFNFGTGDFCIEGLFYFNILPSSTNVNLFQLTKSGGTSALNLTIYNGTGWGAYFELIVNGTQIFHLKQGDMTGWSTNTWYHVAIVRSGNNWYVFRNGAVLLSTTNSTSLSSNFSVPYIGYRLDNGYYLNGYVSEVRISDVARYIAAFTPPKRQLESDSNTKLLLHFNRNDTTFIDSSPSAHTITAYGDAKQLCSPCGSGVAYFDGNGDYLSIPDSDDWYMASSNYFTISFWINIKSIPPSGYGAMLFVQNATNDATYIHYANIVNLNGISQIQWRCKVNNQNAWYIGSKIPMNEFHYIELVRSGNTVYYFVDGVLMISATIAYTPTNISAPLLLGYKYFSSESVWNYAINAYLSEFRWEKGIARHTANFTPQTTPFTPDPYTKLLLHMDGVGNAFYDSSDPPGDNGFPILPDGVTVTPSGTFTTQKMKDGRNIWKFDGSTNYITISDHASWSMFLNDFTIAGWVKFDSIAANKVIIGQYTDANNQWYLQWTTSNIIQLYGITSSTARFNFSCPLTAVANTWYHIVVQRSGSSCIMYINGVAQTVTQTTAFSATATDIAAVLSIGKINTGYQTGNIKDLQIFTKALTMDQISALYQETFIY